MILLICGDREWLNIGPIQDRLELLMELGIKPVVIHGNCRGADKLADKAAKRLGLPVFACDANWEVYDKAAGPIRNGWMADLKPDLGWAFHENIKESKGTKDMVNKLKALQIPVVVFDS
jgi:hypothetical protein